MSTTVVVILAFVAGLYLGHRWGGHDAHVEANDQKRRFQRLLRFAEPYIDAHADAQHWNVDRNDAGEIIDLHEPPIRCGTPHFFSQDLLEAKRLENARNRKDNG
ncbi:MAG: hypothetical protein MUF54_25970 [Polyangiaceae bacterium]|jgi:hypothetical protein|nr:hypothetical protein [Polyangiaceae bacterium]